MWRTDDKTEYYWLKAWHYIYKSIEDENQTIIDRSFPVIEQLIRFWGNEVEVCSCRYFCVIWPRHNKCVCTEGGNEHVPVKITDKPFIIFFNVNTQHVIPNKSFTLVTCALTSSFINKSLELPNSTDACRSRWRQWWRRRCFLSSWLWSFVCLMDRQMIPPISTPSLITAVALSLAISLACLPRWGTWGGRLRTWESHATVSLFGFLYILS